MRAANGNDIMTKPTIHWWADGSRRVSTRDRWMASIADCRGGISVEYAVLIGTVAVSVSVALAALGAPLLQSYDAARARVISPVP